MTFWNEVDPYYAFSCYIITVLQIQIQKISQIMSQLRLSFRCCHYLYHACYSLIFSMQSKHYQILLIIAWNSMFRWLIFSPASLIRPYFSYSLNFGYIFFSVLLSQRQSIVFRKPVLFPVLISQRAS